MAATVEAATMTIVPDDAALCTCWHNATPAEREAAYVGRNKPALGPRGLASCEYCKGVGWWLPARPPDERHGEVMRLRAVERCARQLIEDVDVAANRARLWKLLGPRS